MQSWGGLSYSDDRPTLDLPTKSGVIGLIGAALGLPREDPRQRLVALDKGLLYAVRVDRAGTRGVDFQTIADAPLASGGKRRMISSRHYLYDASFLVLLAEREGGGPGLPVTLERIARALRHPTYILSLGRRACAPAQRILAKGKPLEGEDWTALFAQVPRDPRATHAETLVEVDAGGSVLPGAAVHRSGRLRLFADLRLERLPEVP